MLLKTFETSCHPNCPLEIALRTGIRVPKLKHCKDSLEYACFSRRDFANSQPNCGRGFLFNSVVETSLFSVKDDVRADKQRSDLRGDKD